jgi:hypothetical protein
MRLPFLFTGIKSMDVVLLFTPAFFMFILVIAILVFLLPNAAIIWLLRRKLDISTRIGRSNSWMFLIIPVLLVYIGYAILSEIMDERVAFILGLSCYGLAIPVLFIAVDYCLISKEPFTKIFGTAFYFILLSFSEFAVYELIAHTLYRWEPPVGLL